MWKRTIKLVDISPGAKRSLRGQRGPRGFPGGQGVQGIQGNPGLNGGFDPAKLQYIAGPDVVVPPGRTELAIAYCPTGTTAISGGFFASIGNVAASQTYGPTSHTVFVSNDTSISLTIHAAVVCSAR